MLRPNDAPVGLPPMTYNCMNLRSGLTAIAAVLALSSTPLVAQETTAPPDPVTESTAEPAPAADPLAPEPAASEPAAAEPAASKPAAKTANRTTTRTQAAAPKRAASQAAASQPVRSAAPATATPAIEPPISEATAEPVMVPPGPVPPAEPVAAEPAPAATNLMADDALPIAGAAGLGLLALGGIGLAVQRRRRRREEMQHFKANQAYLDEHPEAAMPHNDEPAFARPARPWIAATSQAAAVRTDAPRTKLPDGFDLSRFGPHVRAAYLGPTPDNPSVSLKYRLRRAAAMDQRLRQEGGARREAERTAARPSPARKPAWEANREGFMLRRAGSGQPARPAYQK